jgi:hypothetical protein
MVGRPDQRMANHTWEQADGQGGFHQITRGNSGALDSMEHSLRMTMDEAGYLTAKLPV